MSLIELRIKELPYPEENVFVLFHAKPNDKGCFDGTEIVRHRIVVAETADLALKQGMNKLLKGNPEDKPYGFFSLSTLKAIGARLKWSANQWAVFYLTSSGLKMELVKADTQLEAASQKNSFMGGVSGETLKGITDLGEMVRIRERGVLFVFSSAEDEALWEAELERRDATPEIQRGVEKRMRMAQEWAEKEEREKRGE